MRSCIWCGAEVLSDARLTCSHECQQKFNEAAAAKAGRPNRQTRTVCATCRLKGDKVGIVSHQKRTGHEGLEYTR